MPEYAPFAYGPATMRYIDACKNATPRRLFLPQLPANTALGPTVAGAPGSRLYTGGGHELAPVAVRIECGWDEAKFAADKAQAAVVAPVADALTGLAEATGLDHGIAGAVAKAIGVPPWVLLVVAGLFLYAALSQRGIVPKVTP